MLPPHRCCLFLVAMLIPASQLRGWADWGRAVTLTTMYEGYLGVEAMVHTWSLGTELSWYFVLPRMGASVLSRRPGRRALPAIAMAVFAILVVGTVVWRWRMGAAVTSTPGRHLAPGLASLLRDRRGSEPPDHPAAGRGSVEALASTVHSGGQPGSPSARRPSLRRLADSPSLAGGHKFEPTSSLQANTGTAANVLPDLVLLVGLVFAAETSVLARVMGSAPVVGAAVFALVERPPIDLVRRLTQNSS
jgi:hypothetical protein